MLAKCRALLSKAESTEFPAEAEQLRAKAFELLAKAGIEAAELEAQPGSEAKIVSKEFVIREAYAVRKAVLLQRAASAMHCKGVRLMGGRGQAGVSKVVVVGYESDMERLGVLFTSLLLQLNNELCRAQVPYGVHARTFRTNFVAGWGFKVAERLRAATSQEDSGGEASSSTALVLFDRKKAVEAACATAYPKVKPVLLRTTAQGFYDGQRAGERASIGQTSVGGSRSALAR